MTLDGTMENIQVTLVGRQPGGALQGLRVPPPIDHLILLHSDDAESRSAALKVKSIAEQMLPEGGVEMVLIDPFGMTDVLAAITSIPRARPNARLTVNLSGGTNIMASAALVACFMLGADAVYIKEDKGPGRRSLEERLIRLPVPRVSLRDLRRPQAKILEVLRKNASRKTEGAVTVVSKQLGMTPQLASYHLKKLASWGLVEFEAVGRRKNVSLTDSGLLFASMLAESA